MVVRLKCRIHAGDDRDAQHQNRTKKVGKNTWLFDEVEGPGNCHAVTSPMNLTDGPHINTVNAWTRNWDSVWADGCEASWLPTSRTSSKSFSKRKSFIVRHSRLAFGSWNGSDPSGIRQLEFNEELHLGEICLTVGARNIIVRVNWDIRRELITLGVRIGECIDEHQFGSEGSRCRYLSNIDEA